MNKRYILFSVNGEMYFIRENNVGISGKIKTECSYHLRRLRKLPTRRILDNLLANMVSSVFNERLVLSDIHPEDKIKELFETPDNLVELIRELPGAFNFRKKVRRAWIL